MSAKGRTASVGEFWIVLPKGTRVLGTPQVRQDTGTKSGRGSPYVHTSCSLSPLPGWIWGLPESSRSGFKC